MSDFNSEIEARNRAVHVQAKRGYSATQPQESQKPDHKWILGALMLLAPAVVCAFTGDAAATRIENTLGTPSQVADTISHLAFMARCGLPTVGLAGAGIGLTRFFRRG